MKTIAFISQKGGCGKSTLSINYSIAACEEGLQVVLIDIDQQQSTVRWSRLRKEENPVILSAHGPNLPQLIEKARSGGADLVVIDTAPHSEHAALEAAKVSDLIIIPCQPSNLDLDAVADSVNIAKLARKPAMFVLNGCKAASSLSAMAIEALEAFKLPIADVAIGHRVSFVHSLTKGQGVVEHEPSGPSAREVRALYKATLQQGDM